MNSNEITSNILVEINKSAFDSSLSDVANISKLIEKQFKLFAKKSEDKKLGIHIQELIIKDKYSTKLYFDCEKDLFQTDLHKDFVSYCSDIVDFANKSEGEQEELKTKYTPEELSNFGKLLKLINAEDAVKISYQKINQESHALETISSASISNNKSNSDGDGDSEDNSFLKSASSVKKDLIVEIKNQEISFSFANADFINGKIQIDLLYHRISGYELSGTRCVVSNLSADFFNKLTKYNQNSDKEWHKCKPKVRVDIKLELPSYANKSVYNVTHLEIIEIILQDGDDSQKTLFDQPEISISTDSIQEIIKPIADGNIESITFSTLDSEVTITSEDAKRIIGNM